MTVEKIEFRFGEADPSLEIPPLFIDLKKTKLKSMVVRKPLIKSKSEEGIVLYVFVTQSRQIEKLFLLKEMHPDLYIPPETNLTESKKEDEELAQFRESVIETEKEWYYVNRGIWRKVFGNILVDMVMIIKKERWTLRPMIHKEGESGYYVEIPVSVELSPEFANVISRGECTEIHDHSVTHHYHLFLESKERFISLAKKYDYYFSENAIWPAAFDVVFF